MPSWFPILISCQKTSNGARHATAFCVLGPLSKCFCESVGFHTGTLASRPFRAAILEKMPLVERSDPSINEEAKKKQAGAQPLEATAPAPTEPQVRRWEDLGKDDLCGCSRPAVTSCPSSQTTTKLLDLLDLLDDTSGHAQHLPPLDPSPGEALIHLLDLPCAPPPPGRPQQREKHYRRGWK